MSKTSSQISKPTAEIKNKGRENYSSSERSQSFFIPGLNAAQQSRQSIIQPKLEISQPGDAYEQEADAIAEKVMTKGESTAPSAEEEEEKLQTKPLAESASLRIQASRNENSELNNTGIENSLNRSKSSGDPLSGQVRSFMENRFGADFSHVKVHTDSHAVQMSKMLNAHAFTHGQDIYFNSGKYNPGSTSGKHLLAHELTHVIQQKHHAQRKIMRAVSETDLETEFNQWAAANHEKINKSSEDYPHQLWTFISTLIMDPNTYGPVARPTDKSKLQEWKIKFEKAGIVAKWLIALKSTSQSDTVKDSAEGRAKGILDYMIQVGLVTEAINLTTGLSETGKKEMFESILKNPSSASASELETIVTFLCAKVADPGSLSLVQSLTNGRTSPLKSLDATKTISLMNPLIAKYGNHQRIVDSVAEILMFNPAIRVSISDKMMESKFGTPDLLFAVLKHKYFIEPGYGATLIKALIPDKVSEEDYEKSRMKKDMPWVYAYKQKYYVNYLIDLAKSQNIVIPKPATMDFTGLKAWLEANTKNIGNAAKLKYPTDPNAIFEIYKNITDIFFYHIPHDRDVEPNQEGKISHLQPGDPDKKRFEADCDVFATYGMRLFNDAGFEPIGYIAYIPIGADSARAAHVGALIRKDKKYYVINNKGILPTTITDTNPGDKKVDALKELSKLAFNDAYGSPRPKNLNIFYADAEANGKMPLLFKNQDNSLLRADLDPNTL